MKWKIPAVLFFVLLALTVLPAALPAAVRAETVSEEQPQNGEKKTVTITVVEEIPAAEIREEAVPLAAAPVTKNSLRSYYIAWGCVIAAAFVFYGVYFMRYKRKLIKLQTLAAEKEKQMLDLYRGAKTDGGGREWKI